MKEGIGVMECWSNGVMGIAELHPSYGTRSEPFDGAQGNGYVLNLKC